MTPTDDGYHVSVGDSEYFLRLKLRPDKNSFVVEVSDKPVEVTVIEASGQRVELVLNGEHLSFQLPAPAPAVKQPPPPSPTQKGTVAAPMPGKVIGALVKKGEKVRAGDPLVIIESMKMEMAVRADADSTVEEILVGEGQSVKRGQGLVRLG